MKIEEQNDALKRKNKVALERYQFAISCIGEPVRTVLDIGCGFGYGSHLMRKAGHVVMGIDNSSEAIEYAEEHYPGAYFVKDIEGDKSFYSGFDFAVCLETLCHLVDPIAFLNSIPVPELIVSAPIDPDPNDGYFYRLHNLSEEQFKNMLADTGWAPIKEFRQKRYLVIHANKYD